MVAVARLFRNLSPRDRIILRETVAADIFCSDQSVFCAVFAERDGKSEPERIGFAILAGINSVRDFCLAKK